MNFSTCRDAHPAAAAAAEIFRVPPPFRGRSASSGPLAPLRPHCNPRSTAAACPRSRSYPGRRRRNFQSPAVVAATDFNPDTPFPRTTTRAVRLPPAPAPDLPPPFRSLHRTLKKKSKSRGGRRRPMADSAGFAIGRIPPPIAGFLGLKNKLSLQGLAGEVLTICKRGCSLATRG